MEERDDSRRVVESKATVGEGSTKKEAQLIEEQRAIEYANKKPHVSYKQAREWQNKVEQYGLYNSKALSYEDYLVRASRLSLKKLRNENEKKKKIDRANDDKAKHRWIPGG